MKVKIAIALPSSGRFVPFDWAMGLMTLKYPMNSGIAMLYLKNKDRAEARNQLVERAKELGAEYIFFVDDDTVPPHNVMTRLLQELEMDKDAAVCGGIYCSKTDPPTPLVYLARDESTHWGWKYGDVFRCWGIGTGCMLIRMSVFDEIEKPWFKEIDWTFDPDKPEEPLDPMIPHNVSAYRMTDDLYFCEKLAQAGKKVLAHGGVLAVHIGQDGKGYVMERNAPPIREFTDPLWYERR
jgi:hypothetical protein